MYVRILHGDDRSEFVLTLVLQKQLENFFQIIKVHVVRIESDMLNNFLHERLGIGASPVNPYHDGTFLNAIQESVNNVDRT